MNFKIGDKVTYCGNNEYLRKRFYKEYEEQEVNIGEVVDILENNYFGQPLVKIKFENGYLAGREEDFCIYKEPKNKESFIYLVEGIQEAEDKAKFFFCGKDEGSISFEIDFKEDFGETSEEKFLGAILSAVEKTSHGLISEFINSSNTNNNEDCCEDCCKDDCVCENGCECECENCHCKENKEDKNEIIKTKNENKTKAYSGKIYCLDSGYVCTTKGKIYKVEDGSIYADENWIIRIAPEKEEKIPTTFEEFSKFLRGRWLEVKESSEEIKFTPYEADIICVYASAIENFTIGKIYTIKDGFICDDKGNKISWYGSPFTNIDAINSYCTSIFKEIKQ